VWAEAMKSNKTSMDGLLDREAPKQESHVLLAWPTP